MCALSNLEIDSDALAQAQRRDSIIAMGGYYDLRYARSSGGRYRDYERLRNVVEIEMAISQFVAGAHRPTLPSSSVDWKHEGF